MSIDSYPKLPFFEPVKASSHFEDMEKLSSVGRFAENVFNWKGRRTMTIVSVSNTNTVVVKKGQEEPKSIIKTVLKLIILIVFFPFFLGVKLFYRLQNKFVVEEIRLHEKFPKENNPLPIVIPVINLLSLDENLKTLPTANANKTDESNNLKISSLFVKEALPQIERTDFSNDVETLTSLDTLNVGDQFDVEEKGHISEQQNQAPLETHEISLNPVEKAIEKPTHEKVSKEKMSKEDLLFEANRFFSENNFEKALNLFGLYIVRVQNQEDDSKNDVIEKGLKCLESLGYLKDQDITKLSSIKKYVLFLRKFAHFKEFYQELDESIVAAKLQRFGKISLSKPEKRQNIPVSSNLEIIDSVEDVSISNSFSIEIPFPFSLSATVGIPYESVDGNKMEDVSIIDIFNIEQEGQIAVEVYLYGVCDGHPDISNSKGQKAAGFFGKNLSKFLKEELDKKASLSDLNIWNALKIAPVRLNQEFKSLPGSTYCFAMIFKDPTTNANVIWTANAGDSGAILGLGREKCIQLSTPARYRDESIDENPRDKKFLNSIALRNGVLIAKEGIKRLGGVLQPLRGIGHNPVSQNLWSNPGEIKGLSARPEIMKVDTSIIKKDLKLVLFTDGTSDVMSSEEINEMVQNVPLVRAANKVVEHAIKCGSKDNNVVLVIDVEYKEAN